MKKKVSLLSVLALVLMFMMALAACGGGDSEDDDIGGGQLASVVFGESVEDRNVQTTIKGSADNIVYTVIEGSLPLGVTLESDGTLSGIAWSEAGEYEFTVLAAKQNSKNSRTDEYTLVVEKAELTVTANDKSRDYGDENPLFDGIITGYKKLNGITTMGEVTGDFVYACDADALSNAGEYKISATASAVESNHYSFRFVDAALTINKVTITITANDKSCDYGDSTPTFDGTVTGLKSGQTFESLGIAGEYSYDCAVTLQSNAGIYEIKVNSTLESPNHTFVYTDGTLTINKVTITITANNKSCDYGDSTPAFDGTITGLKNGQTLESLGIVGEYSYDCAVTPQSNAGIYEIKVTSTLESHNHTFVYTDATLTINKISIAVRVSNKTKLYGDPDPEYSAIAPGLKNGHTIINFAAIYDVTGTAGTDRDVGVYTISLELQSAFASNYDITYQTGTLTVTKASLTVKADDKIKVAGEDDPEFTATAIGLTNDHTLDDFEVIYEVTGTAGTDREAGVYTITPELQGVLAANYDITYQTGTLTVRVIIIQNVAAGAEHSFAIDEYGYLWAWGDNTYGQLGLGDWDDRSFPVQVGTNKYKAIAAGEYHSLALDEDGYLWAWGDNTYGQLGLGNYMNQKDPIRVNSKIYKAIVAGEIHSFAIDENDYLWAWGNNSYGQLGVGDRMIRNIPIQVDTNKYKTIAAGITHSLAIDEYGYLRAWGDNTHSQLGLGDTANRTTPVQVGLSKYTAVAAGESHSLAIDDEGFLWTWGNNTYGQLGLGDNTNRPAPVKIGSKKYTTVIAINIHSFAIDTDGYLWAWGYNGYGQLGFGDRSNRNMPMQVGAKQYKMIAAGYEHSLAIDEDGFLWACGSNDSGQLGLGDFTRRAVPTRVR